MGLQFNIKVISSMKVHNLPSYCKNKQCWVEERGPFMKGSLSSPIRTAMEDCEALHKVLPPMLAYKRG